MRCPVVMPMHNCAYAPLGGCDEGLQEHDHAHTFAHVVIGLRRLFDTTRALQMSQLYCCNRGTATVDIIVASNDSVIVAAHSNATTNRQQHCCSCLRPRQVIRHKATIHRQSCMWPPSFVAIYNAFDAYANITCDWASNH